MPCRRLAVGSPEHALTSIRGTETSEPTINRFMLHTSLQRDGSTVLVIHPKHFRSKEPLDVLEVVSAKILFPPRVSRLPNIVRMDQLRSEERRVGKECRSIW